MFDQSPVFLFRYSVLLWFRCCDAAGGLGRDPGDAKELLQFVVLVRNVEVVVILEENMEALNTVFCACLIALPFCTLTIV